MMGQTSEFNLIHESSGPMDSHLLEFAAKHNCEFRGSVRIGEDRFYKVLSGGVVSYHQIIGINDYTHERKRFSIIYKENTESDDTGEDKIVLNH